jgi:hypothetical protein
LGYPGVSAGGRTRTSTDAGMFRLMLSFSFVPPKRHAPALQRGPSSVSYPNR